MLEKLKNGYRLRCPEEIEQITAWSPETLFDDLACVCFTADPLDRASFSQVVEMIKEELSPDEIMHYNQMRDIYQSTHADNYLGFSRS